MCSCNICLHNVSGQLGKKLFISSTNVPF